VPVRDGSLAIEREEGRIADQRSEEVTDVVKTLGHVIEYWMADPQRAFELKSKLGKSYLELWASTAKRLAGEEVTAVAAPDGGPSASAAATFVDWVLGPGQQTLRAAGFGAP
jgi:hypothetical protein